MFESMYNTNYICDPFVASLSIMEVIDKQWSDDIIADKVHFAVFDTS